MTAEGNGDEEYDELAGVDAAVIAGAFDEINLRVDPLTMSDGDCPKFYAHLRLISQTPCLHRLQEEVRSAHVICGSWPSSGSPPKVQCLHEDDAYLHLPH